MGIVVHSIIPCDDAERAKDFYSALFPHWRFKSLPPNQFWEITDADGSYPHTIFLAMMMGQGTPSSPTSYYAVADIDSALLRAVELGATVIVPKTPVPGKGYYAELLDVLQNNFGLWEDDPPSNGQ